MKLLPLILALALSGCTLFNVPKPNEPEAPKIDLVARLITSTIALTTEDGDVFCSGVAAEGVFVTAAHCVDELAPSPFRVRYLGKSYAGVKTLVWEDRDLAFVDAVGARMKAQLPLTSWAPQVGQKVVWYGYPAGLEEYMGTGIVANVNSQAFDKGFIAVYGQFIGGNSGGPVVDESGALVGVVSSTLIYRGQMVPVGYVVPPGDIQTALDSL